MDELDIEDLKILLSFYRQKSNDLEWSNLLTQVKLNKEVLKNSQDIAPNL